MTKVLPIIASLLLGFAGGQYVAPQAVPSDTAPMPGPTKPDASPLSPSPDKAKTVSVARVEVLDSKGVVAIVFTAENGVPIAIVNDRGTARKIDLAKVARMVK